MKTREEIEELAAKEHWTSNIESRSYIKGYAQCQEDMLAVLRSEILSAFIHGQGNARGMEAGLERDETDDYVRSRMGSLTKRKE